MAKKLSVMLVDDNEIDLFLHEKFLERSGIANQILKFVFAGDALQYLMEKEEALLPDLILLDIQMPVINGFAFLDQYDKLPEIQKTKCQFIMLSSSLDFGDLSRAKAHHRVLGLLNKPIEMNELIQMLQDNGIL